MHSLALLLALILSSAAPSPAPDQIYEGACDGSTAVALGSDRFLAAEDEHNVLRIYTIGKPEPQEIDIADHLALDNKKEVDLEGSAMLGETLYWITSHGRNSDGEVKPNRFRLIALTPKPGGGVEQTGQPYKGLMEDMLADSLGSKFNLTRLDLPAAKELAPEAQGRTNIEGLAAWKSNQLLIAFRNPIPEGKALLVPLENPDGVIKGEKSRFGAPILLDLGGRGIRSIELRAKQRDYVIVAGAFDDTPDFQLFLWDPAKPPKRVDANLSGIRPEGIVLVSNRPDEALLLSDDGGVMVKFKGKDTECKKLPPDQQTFQSRWVSLK
jgi:hypothetical protein